MAGNLRDIRVKTPSVIVLTTDPAQVLVAWDIERTAQDLRSLQFFVDRGESPSEMAPVTGVGIGPAAAREYVDYTANLLDLQKVYYYRVRAVEFQAGTPVQTFTSPATTWDGALDLVALYVVEEHLFLARWVAGVPVMIFKKRHEGLRCPECWDAVLERVTKSNCRTCLGTGFYQGFYTGMPAWVNFEPDPKVSQVADWGKRQDNQTDVQFTNYPLLSEDDVIIELKLNKIWKVSNVRAAEKNRATTLQMMRVSAVNPTDVEYRLEVDEGVRRQMVAELEAREKEREF